MEFIFLQEKHSIISNENTWVNDFDTWMFFSHGASKSCSIIIAYLGKTTFVLSK